MYVEVSPINEDHVCLSPITWVQTAAATPVKEEVSPMLSYIETRLDNNVSWNRKGSERIKVNE